MNAKILHIDMLIWDLFTKYSYFIRLKFVFYFFLFLFIYFLFLQKISLINA